MISSGEGTPSDSREELLKEATLAAEQERFAKALALCDTILSVQKRFIPALLLKGQVLQAQKQFDAAAEVFEIALSVDSRSAEAAAGLGIALVHLNRAGQALPLLERAVSGGHESVDAFTGLATCYSLAGRHRLTLGVLRRAVSLDPNSASLLVRFAEALIQEEQREEAFAVLTRAIDLDADCAGAYDAMAFLLLQFGRFEEAEKFARNALKLEPENPVHYVRFVFGSRFDKADMEILQRLLGLSASGRGTVRERIAIQYSLGKALEDLERYDEAGEHYLKANRVALEEQRRKGELYDKKSHLWEVDLIIEAFSKSKIASFGIRQNKSEVPVLLVGMMRSGTTLAEQILSSRPQVCAGGEQVFWRDRGPKLHMDLVQRGQTANLEKAAESYLNLLKNLGLEKTRVCDKLPQNYMMLGLVHAVLPNVRIVHCRRNPQDTCLSIFTTPFTYPPPFAHDPDSISFAYRQYLRLMTHWRSVLPEDRFLEIDYEDVVYDREQVSRRMIEFLGLEWSNECLFPERNTRLLGNPSQWQARQPVYNSSVGRWKHFVPSLGSAIDLWNLV